MVANLVGLWSIRKTNFDYSNVILFQHPAPLLFNAGTEVGKGLGEEGAPCSLSQIIGFVQKHQDGKYTLAAHLVLMNIIILCSLTILILNCGLIQ